MKFLANWKDVITRAWSMRMALLTSTLAGLTIALPMFSVEGWENLLAIGTFLSAVGTGIARLADQGIASAGAGHDEAV